MAEVDYESLPENTPFSVQLAAGALAGITEHIVMHPLDSIKVSLLNILPLSGLDGSFLKRFLDFKGDRCQYFNLPRQ